MTPTKQYNIGQQFVKKPHFCQFHHSNPVNLSKPRIVSVKKVQGLKIAIKDLLWNKQPLRQGSQTRGLHTSCGPADMFVWPTSKILKE